MRRLGKAFSLNGHVQIVKAFRHDGARLAQRRVLRQRRLALGVGARTGVAELHL